MRKIKISVSVKQKFNASSNDWVSIVSAVKEKDQKDTQNNLLIKQSFSSQSLASD